MVQIHQVEQGSPAWHSLRKEYPLTGSTAHRLLKYGRANAMRANLEDKAFSGNFWTKRGHVLEDDAIELYDNIRKVKSERPGFVTNTTFPDCGYSPDGLDGRVLLEVKCFSKNRHLMLNNKFIPFEIMAQIQFGLLVLNLTRAKLIAYNPKVDPKEALKIIDVKMNRNAMLNFKRLLKGESDAKTGTRKLQTMVRGNTQER